MKFLPKQKQLHLPRPFAFTGTQLLEGLTLLTCAATLGCQPQAQRAHHDPIRLVLSVVVGEQTLLESSYSGKIDSRYNTDLGFRLLGRIVTREAHVGEVVEQGQRLATMDTLALEISVQSAKAALTIRQVESDNAASGLNRLAVLLSRNATSQADFELAKKADEAAKALVTQAEADLDKARERLDYAELKADMSGVVTGVYAEIGETVTAGQVVFSLANPDQREAIIDVSEDSIGSVELNRPFRIVLTPSIICTGNVREIAPQADAKTQSRRVRITLTDPSESFRLGATIKAFPQPVLTENLILPVTSILDQDGQTFAWRIDETKKQVHLVAVAVAKRESNRVLISAGIRPGDRIVIAGVHSLTEGQSIKLQSEVEQ